MEQNTPRFWTKLFKWFCNDSFYEELQGDLEEAYLNNFESKGRRKAKSIYRKEVLKMIRGSVIKPKTYIPRQLKFALFRMHLLLSIRSIRRNISFTVLNVVGFAAAISVCLFITNTILTAYRLDKDFSNRENKYRISTLINTDKETQFVGTSPVTLFSHLASAIPEAKTVANLKSNSVRMNYRGRDITVNGIEVSPDFFKILDYKILSGSLESVIKNPSHVAVTEDFLKKYSFDNEITVKQFGPYVISAILESPGLKSHLQFEWLNFSDALNKPLPVELRFDYYIDHSRSNYIEVHDNANLERIQEKLNMLAAQMNDSLVNKSYHFQLENLSGLGRSEASSYQADLLTNDGIRIMIIFMLIMTGIASINYTNLASAKAMNRLKEVGVRKVIGSKRLQIFNQFLIETCLLGFLGLAIGFFLYYWFAKDFSEIIPFAFDSKINFDTVAAFILTTISISLLAGIIPGLFLARISPLSLFKPKNSSKTFSFQTVRKTLLVIQLTITAFVFVMSALLWKQYNSYQKEDIGMNISDNYLLEFDYPDSVQSLIVLKNEIEKLPEVAASSFMSKLIPIDDVNGLMMVKTENREDSVMTSIAWADTSFLHTYKPQMTVFNPSFLEKPSVLVNKSFITQLSIPIEAALGTNVWTGKDMVPISGVFEKTISSNFNPIYTPGKDDGTNFSEAVIISPNLVHKLLVVRTAPKSEAFPKIEQTFLKIFPEKNLAFRSVEDLSKNRYTELRQIVKVFSYIFICIVLITLMGQMGMAIFQAETKAKEIGIRKVLGASVTRISLHLIKGTLVQIVIAILIATPAAYIVFNNMTRQFRKQIELSPQLLAVILILFVSIILLSVISLTAPRANANPVNALRNE